MQYESDYFHDGATHNFLERKDMLRHFDLCLRAGEEDDIRKADRSA